MENYIENTQAAWNESLAEIAIDLPCLETVIGVHDYVAKDTLKPVEALVRHNVVRLEGGNVEVVSRLDVGQGLALEDIISRHRVPSIDSGQVLAVDHVISKHRAAV